jgi:hypothetical protein
MGKPQYHHVRLAPLTVNRKPPGLRSWHHRKTLLPPSERNDPEMRCCGPPGRGDRLQDTLTLYGPDCDYPNFEFHRDGIDPAGYKHIKTLTACGMFDESRPTPCPADTSRPEKRSAIGPSFSATM